MNFGTLHVVNSTITGNGLSGIPGGGINTTSGILELDNSIVAGNIGNLGPDIRGAVSAGSFNNFIGDGRDMTGLADGDANGNHVGTTASPLDPRLGTLQDNGGTTPTRAPLADTFDIDGDGDTSEPLPLDQSGQPRVIGPLDIGAVEALVVDNPIDEDDGDYSVGNFSLREAIFIANLHPGLTPILFDPTVFGTPQIITLTLGELLITSSIDLQGPGQDLLTISGNGVSRVFNVDDGTATAMTVAISGVTVTGGQAATLSGGLLNTETLALRDVTFTANNGFTGGAIENFGDLTIERGTITANTAFGSGGIHHVDGTLTIRDSTISGNTATGGAAGGIGSTAPLLITGSTISGNTAASGTGGGIVAGFNPVTIINSTISGNTADWAGGLAINDSLAAATRLVNVTVTDNRALTAFAGGIVNFGGTPSTTVLRNTIVAGNFLGASGAAASDLAGSFNTTDSSNNLIGDAATSGGFVHGTNGNIVGNAGTGVIDITTVLDTTLADGADAVLRNVIAGNVNDGIDARDSSGVEIRGNYIGLDASGLVGIGNDVDGVYFENSGGGTIAGNVISDQGWNGVFLLGSGSSGNLIQNNFIGTDKDGADAGVGNSRLVAFADGVFLAGGFTAPVGGGPSNNTISGNTIAFNRDSAISIGAEDPTDLSTGNVISENAIFANAGLGIDLLSDEILMNDADDTDVGPNSVQNFPVLTDLVDNGDGTVTFTISLNSDGLTGAEYLIEIFANSTGDGEGERFVDSVMLTFAAANTGSVSATVTVPAGLPFLTATARNVATGDTSEFSAVLGAFAAVDDGYTVDEDGSLSGNVLDNDFLAGEELDEVVVVGALPTGVALTSADGSFTYDPPANFNGPVTFQYQVRTSGGTLSNVATVTIDVTAVNDAPTVSSPPSASLFRNGSFTFTGASLISVADVDAGSGVMRLILAVDSGTLTLSGTAGVTFENGTTNGSTAIEVTGTLTALNTALNGLLYQPAANTAGDFSLTITIDDQGSTGGPAEDATATVTLEVTARPPSRPIGNGRIFSMARNTTLTVPAATGLLLGAVSPDNAPLSISNVTPVVNSQNQATGTLNVDLTTGAFSYTPPLNFTGAVTFTCQFFDGLLTSDPITITINVTGGNFKLRR